MIVNVRMADGRTTFQFASRADLRRVLGREPGDDCRPVRAWAKWNPEDPYWIEVRLPYVRRHSIAFVVAAEDVAFPSSADGELPAKSEGERRAQRWRERQAASA